jgi:hypothetical protein
LAWPNQGILLLGDLQMAISRKNLYKPRKNLQHFNLSFGFSLKSEVKIKFQKLKIGYYS